ncbi:MAG: hypothetical protein ACTHWZ_00095 [Peptoniphilaceae bacterium]
MNIKSKTLSRIFLFSIIFLVLSLLFFAYSRISISAKKELENDNLKLKRELKFKEKEHNKFIKLEKEYENKLESLRLEFASKYGYDFNQDEKTLISNEIKNLEFKNSSILKQIKEKIIFYSAYYKGEYYEDDSLESLISKFTNLNSNSRVEIINSDLYSELDIDKFIEKAKKSGTIAYLNSINKENKENNLNLLTTTLYSKDFYNISDTNLNLSKVQAEINALCNNYKYLEYSNFNTGNLTYSNLLNLKIETDYLINQYYKNQGVINILKEIGDNYEKFK